MSIIDLNKVKRINRLDVRGSYVAQIHFDEDSMNHKTVLVPVSYLDEKLAEAVKKIEPGEDVEWKYFLRKHKLKHLLDA